MESTAAAALPPPKRYIGPGVARRWPGLRHRLRRPAVRRLHLERGGLGSTPADLERPLWTGGFSGLQPPRRHAVESELGFQRSLVGPHGRTAIENAERRLSGPPPLWRR